MYRINTNEMEIHGYRSVSNQRIINIEACDRIQWLLENSLNLLATDGVQWSMLYQNPDDKKYWNLSYPCGDMHGGGPPSLVCVSREKAKELYPDMF